MYRTKSLLPLKFRKMFANRVGDNELCSHLSAAFTFPVSAEGFGNWLIHQIILGAKFKFYEIRS